MKLSFKRILSLLIAVCMVCSMLPANALAATEIASGTCGTNLTWTLDENYLLTISGTGEMKNYAAASNTPWSTYRTRITAVEVASGVTSIGDRAFSSCENMTSVTLPEGITSIGTYAFYWTGITEITLPQSLESIGKNAFECCFYLKSLTIPGGLTSTGDYAFYNCSGLTDLVIEEGVQVIGGSAFGSCDVLKNVTLPQSLTTINSGAFSYCAALEEITIPAGVTSVPYSIFSGCSSLSKIVFQGNAPSSYSGRMLDDVTATAYYPANNTTWTEDVMSSYGGTITWVPSYAEIASGSCGENAEWVLLENGLLTISGTGAVDTHPWDAYYADITAVVIEEGITAITCRNAFDTYYNLVNVTIPSTMTYIEDFAFYQATGLKNVYITDMAAWCAIDFVGTESNPLCYAEAQVASLEEELDEKKLYLNGELVTDLVIPEGTTKIGNYAFRNYKYLTSVTIPASVTEIGDWAFQGCSYLTKIVFLGDMPEVGLYPFDSLTATVYVPYEGRWVDLDPTVWTTNTETLNWIPTLTGQCGENLTWTVDLNTGTLTISGTGEMYDYTEEAPSWYAALTDLGIEGIDHTALAGIVVEEGVTSIGIGAFADHSGVRAVSLPETLTSIGAYAFLHCSNVTEVSLPESLTSIGEGAFCACSSLTTVNIPVGVTEIGGSPFGYCEKLTSITVDEDNQSFCVDEYGVLYTKDMTTLIQAPAGVELGDYVIPNGVTTIGMYAFDTCVYLTSVTIPDSVVTIGEGAFFCCEELTAVDIGSGVETIEICAFDGCLSLAAVTIPESVKTIGNCAFQGCENLTDITFQGSAPTIGEGAFNGVEAIAYYPADNATWTSVVMQQYGGIITWEPWFEPGNITWTLEDGVLTISGEGFMENYSGQGEAPWYGEEQCNQFEITKIVIEEGVRSIGAYAFDYLGNVTEITIPSTVVYIGERACSDMKDLEKVNITDLEAWCGIRMVSYYSNPLSGFSAQAASLDEEEYESRGPKLMLNGELVTELPAMDGVTKIGDFAFANYLYLEQVDLSNVTSVGVGAFYYCEYLEEVIWGEKLTTIGDQAFECCIALTELDLPDSVETIGMNAFWYNNGLTSIAVPKGVTYLGEGAFGNCVNVSEIYYNAAEASCDDNGAFRYTGDYDCLISVTIGKDVKVIPARLFYGNYDPPYISTVEFEEGGACTMIGDYAFYRSRYLKTITLPDSLTSIGYAAFQDCTELTEIVIPENVTYVGGYAFYNCLAVKKLEILGDLTCIEPYCFYRCAAEEIVIPDTVTTIGSYAFYYCDSVWSIDIPDSVTSIGISAFRKCIRLTDVTIGSGVKSIGSYAFGDCEYLKKIWFEGNPPAIASNAFYGVTSYACYPSGDATWTEDVMQQYEGTITWAVYDPETGVYALESGTCGENLTWTMYSDGTLSITGSGAMDNYSSKEAPWYSYADEITKVEIAEGVTSIGSYAFYDCDALTEVTISDTVTTIGKNAFYDCDALRGIVIPASVTSVYDNAFGVCYLLRQIVFEGSAPTFTSGALQSINATLYYPAGDETWTDAVNGNYSGSVKWTGLCQSHTLTQVAGNAATCTAEGNIAYYTCGECGIFFADAEGQTMLWNQDVVVAAKGHTEVVDAAVAPTCTTTGLTEGSHCDVCGEVLGAQTEVPVLSHSYTSQVTKEPTCTEEGEMTYACACGDTYTEPVAATGLHTYTNGFCEDCDAYEPAVFNGDVYEISNAGQLYWFAAKVNGGETALNAKLMQDIDVNEGWFTIDESGEWNVDNSVSVRSFKPIVTYAGVFDGNGYSISNLSIRGNGTNGWGFIIELNGGTVQNLAIVNSMISNSDYGPTGMIVGKNTGGTIRNCVTKSYVSGHNSTGGIVGINTGTIEDCENQYRVFGDSGVGGIAAYSTGPIANCRNVGEISGDEKVGGIVGQIWGCKVSDCENGGTVTLETSNYAGGIVGYCSGIVTKCVNSGTVTIAKDSLHDLGGIAGFVVKTNDENITVRISDCCNTGKVIAKYTSMAASYVGGIAGNLSGSVTVENCYQAGMVSGNVWVGAVVGAPYTDATISNCFYLEKSASGYLKYQNGVGYSNYSYTQADTAGKTTVMSSEQFASGEVAYLLNADRAEPVWFQTCGEGLPAFSGSIVYRNQIGGCTTNVVYGYSNEPADAVISHTEVTDEAVAPDCENTGLTEGSHCDVCGEVLVAQEVVDALGHSGGDVSHNCTVCGAQISICGVSNVEYGGCIIGVSNEAVAKLKPTTFAQKAGMDILMEKVNNCAVFWGKPTNVENYEDFLRYMKEILDIDDTADLLGDTDAERVTNKLMEIAYAYSLEEDQVWGNAAVLYVSHLAQTMTMDEITEFLTSGSLWTTARENVDNAETYGLGLTQAALAYGMYNAYAYYIGSAELIERTNSIGDTMDHVDDAEFVEFVRSEQGQKDLAGFLAALSIADDACAEVQAVETIIGKNFNDPNLVSLLNDQLDNYSHDCGICGTKLTECVPTKLPAQSPTCTETGLTTGTKCVLCEMVLCEQEEVAALGHTVVVDEAVAATCTETGKTEGKHCSVCNEVLVAQETVAAVGHQDEDNDNKCDSCGESMVELFDIYGSNMTLGNDLAMNFFILQSDLDPNSADYYVVITKMYADERENVTKTIAYNEFTQQGSLWKITFNGVAAKEMADTMTVVVYNGDGVAVSNVYTMSIREYAMKVLDSAKSSAELKTTVVDMLNYGAAAQVFFNYNTGDLANCLLNEEQSSYATQTIEYSNRQEKGAKFYGSVLSLESNIILNLYFTGITRDMYATVTYTDYLGRDKTIKVDGSEFTERGSLIGVKVDELVVGDGYQIVSCEIFDADGNKVASVKDSVESYVARAMASSNADPIYECLAKFVYSAKVYLLAK